MAIGIWELIAVLVMVVAGIVWLLVRIFRKSARESAVRPAAERLAELESLKNAGQITAAEYEKQRAAVVSSI